MRLVLKFRLLPCHCPDSPLHKIFNFICLRKSKPSHHHAKSRLKVIQRTKMWVQGRISRRHDGYTQLLLESELLHESGFKYFTKNIEKTYIDLSAASLPDERVHPPFSLSSIVLWEHSMEWVVRHRSNFSVDTSPRKESAAVFAGGHWFPSNGPTTFDGSCPGAIEERDKQTNPKKEATNEIEISMSVCVYKDRNQTTFADISTI
jgi:hypothetical protein